MKVTDNPADKTVIEFCMLGRVVRAEVFEGYSLLLRYDDGKRLTIEPTNYGDALGITLKPERYPEPPSGDMLLDCDPSDEDGYLEPSSCSR